MNKIIETDDYFLEAGENASHFLVTTAMTEKHYANWFLYSLSSWRVYARRYGLGILCFKRDLIDRSSPAYKNGSWQKMLAPMIAHNLVPNISRVCLIDSDIVVGPFAANIFEHAPEGFYSVVSLINNLPFPEALVLRRIAFFRNKYYSNSYPLDSFLLGDPFDEFRDLGLEPPENYFCAGVVVLDISMAGQMRDWYFSVESSKDFDAWEQTHLNYWIQNSKHYWLPYEFQAIWKYEMAWKYPFLYSLGESIQSSELAGKCIRASLWNSHFLHFAGSWHESLGWKQSVINLPELDDNVDNLSSFLSAEVTGAKKGKITPECM